MIISNLNGQTTSGEIKYGERFVKMGIDTSKIKETHVKAVVMEQIQATKKALSTDNELYILKFNQTESIFQPLPFMENDANPNLKWVISQGKYYTNISEPVVMHQLYIFGDTYRVKKNNDFDWQILGKNKTIQNFNCILAVSKVEIRPGHIIEVEAWFAPEIPLPFGPKGYGGLPGLILGLKEKGRYFYATGLNLKQKNIQIDYPSSGKMISEQELEKMAKKYRMKMD